MVLLLLSKVVWEPAALQLTVYIRKLRLCILSASQRSVAGSLHATAARCSFAFGNVGNIGRSCFATMFLMYSSTFRRTSGTEGVGYLAQAQRQATRAPQLFLGTAAAAMPLSKQHLLPFSSTEHAVVNTPWSVLETDE